MAKMIIEIDMGNAAFDDSPEFEISRILRGFCERICELEMTEPGDKVALFDANGNRVGFARHVVEG